jgi:quercetin dioxygenase-like cupin family protein
MNDNPLHEIGAGSQPAPIVLSVPDLSEALAFFTERLGFRLEMVLPADAPHTAVVSGSGLKLRLESAEAHVEPPSAGAPAFVLNRLDANAVWQEGRAGMQYRDLIPGRLGGRVIASHIRIPGGGEVPDYVHYHKVRFQMIYCKAGWVRVVYEDQGPPFVLEAGDCVLQPPEIRHRVLESSPGLEVIEASCPAVHETHADHTLTLPTSSLQPDRLFGGQRFVRHRAHEAEWNPWIAAGFDACDTGIAAATNRLGAVHIVRAAAESSARIQHTDEFIFLFILRGALDLDSPVEGNHRLSAGDSCVLPAGVAFTLRASGDLEMLDVRLK